MSSLSDFKRRFQCTLLPVADSGMRVGMKAEWDNLQNNHVEIEPTYITDRLDLSDDDTASFEKQWSDIALQPTGKADITSLEIVSRHEVETGLSIPSIGVNLSGKIDVSEVLCFSYEGVSARFIDASIGRPFIHELVAIKRDNSSLWRRINDYWFIEKLYYAKSVCILVKRSYSSELKAILSSLNTDVHAESNGLDNSLLQMNSREEIPFACRLEKVSDYAK